MNEKKEIQIFITTKTTENFKKKNNYCLVIGFTFYRFVMFAVQLITRM